MVIWEHPIQHRSFLGLFQSTFCLIPSVWQGRMKDNQHTHLKLEVVLDGLPRVDIAAVGQPKHQNFNGQDEEVGSLFSKEF